MLILQPLPLVRWGIFRASTVPPRGSTGHRDARFPALLSKSRKYAEHRSLGWSPSTLLQRQA